MRSGTRSKAKATLALWICDTSIMHWSAQLSPQYGRCLGTRGYMQLA